MQTMHGRRRWSVAAVALTFALSSCATLFTRPTQQVPVQSEPPGAEVFVNGEYQGTTPITLALPKRGEHVVVLRYGGQQRSLTLDTVVDSTYLALDIAPGLVTAGLSGVLIASVDRSDARSAQFVVIGAMGVVVGLSSAVINAGIDAATGRWYRFTPGEVLIVFD